MNYAINHAYVWFTMLTCAALWFHCAFSYLIHCYVFTWDKRFNELSSQNNLLPWQSVYTLRYVVFLSFLFVPFPRLLDICHQRRSPRLWSRPDPGHCKGGADTETKADWRGGSSVQQWTEVRDAFGWKQCAVFNSLLSEDWRSPLLTNPLQNIKYWYVNGKSSSKEYINSYS